MITLTSIKNVHEGVCDYALAISNHLDSESHYKQCFSEENALVNDQCFTSEVYLNGKEYAKCSCWFLKEVSNKPIAIVN